jgi:WD repeat-containing protein 55
MFQVRSHPHSVDALCAIPTSYASSSSTVLTGSSDGMLRAVQLYPTKLLGIVADHGEFPVERIAVDMGGEGRWVGSAGHDEVLKLTDLRGVFEDEHEVDDEGVDVRQTASTEGEEDQWKNEMSAGSSTVPGAAESEAERENDDGLDDNNSDLGAQQEKKRKRKREKAPLIVKRKKGKNEVEVDASFFACL